MTTNAVATTHQGGAVALPTSDPFALEALNSGAKLGTFLSFDGNDGTYLYGPKDDKKELPHGSQLALDMTAYMRGWLCWKDSTVVERVMINIMQGTPPADSGALTDHGPYKTYSDGTQDGWVVAGEIGLVDVNEGNAYTFNFFGQTKYSAFGRLCGEYSKVFRQHPGEHPVIEISARSFEPKGVRAGTKKWAPSYKIVGWIPDAEFHDMQAAASAASASAPAAADGSDDPANYSQAPVETVNPTTAAASTPAPTVEAVVTPAPVETPPTTVQAAAAPAAAAAPETRRSKRFS